MAFVKESFMERSDGAKIPLCTSCGTIPVYNPRLNIKICPLCDGPVRFTGDNINNLEILPPLGRPKSNIVEVEMPYSVKILTQEQETYLNLSMRFITTKGVTQLQPLEFSGTSSEIVKELPRLILPETVVPAYIEDIPQATLTVEQLRSMGAQVAQMSEAERAVLDTVLEETPEGQELAQQAQLDAIAQLQGDMTAPGEVQKNQIVVPGQEVQVAAPALPAATTFGGMPPPNLETTIGGEGMVRGPSVPGMGPVITVRTDAEAMMADGIMPQGFGGMARQVRRNPFRGGMMAPMSPMMSRYTPSMDGGGGDQPMAPHAPVRVNKLE